MEAIFFNLNELHELSIKLLGDLDECIEMSGEIGGNSSVPQVGVIFEDIAEVSSARHPVMCWMNSSYCISYVLTMEYAKLLVQF